jgi:hypothetical protein
LSKVKFLVQTEGNFEPAIFPGNILVINTEDRKITSAYYILSYGQGSYALRKLDPIDQDTVRVVSGTTETSESRDMPASMVKNLIEKTLERIAVDNVQFIRLQFNDVVGMPKTPRSRFLRQKRH